MQEHHTLQALVWGPQVPGNLCGSLWKSKMRGAPGLGCVTFPSFSVSSRSEVSLGIFPQQQVLNTSAYKHEKGLKGK